MKKKLIIRCLFGAPIGLTISYIITIIVSLCINKGVYYPAAHELIKVCGGELNAVIVQMICSLIYGAVFAGSSVIWELDNWSLLKQTAVHCSIVSLTTFPIAYLMHWFPHNIIGVIVYFAILLFIYAGIWFSQYNAMKKKLRSMNDKLKTDFRK